MTTLNNLQEAFAGESQANRKYLAFAVAAEKDGLPQIAKLFRAAAAAETVHAHNHLRVMGGIQTTKENLKSAIAGEGFEFQEMYPKFIQEAEAEGNTAATISFKSANAVEEIHHNLYSEALGAIESRGDLPDREIYVCEICGNTVYDHAPDTCPICQAPKAKFFAIQ